MESQLKSLEDRISRIEGALGDIQKAIQNNFINRKELENTFGEIFNLSKSTTDNLQKLRKTTEESEEKTNSRIEKYYELSSNESKQFKEEIDSKLAKTVDATKNNLVQIKEFIENGLNENKENLNKLQNNLDITKEKLNSEDISIKELSTKNLEFINLTQEQVMQLNQALEQQKNNLLQNINEKTAEINKNHQESVNEFRNSVSQISETLQNHASTLLSMGEMLTGIQEANQKTFELLKNDQKQLMISFQRMNTGLSETLRNENIIIAKEVRESLEHAEKLASANYMGKDDQKVLEERITTLDTDLRKKSEDIRQELVTSFEKAIKNFDERGKDSIEKVEEYKSELEQYKEELQSLIERKVNAKYDFIFGIITDMVGKTENLAKLITDSKIKEVQVVQEGNISESKENVENEIQNTENIEE